MLIKLLNWQNMKFDKKANAKWVYQRQDIKVCKHQWYLGWSQLVKLMFDLVLYAPCCNVHCQIAFSSFASLKLMCDLIRTNAQNKLQPSVWLAGLEDAVYKLSLTKASSHLTPPAAPAPPAVTMIPL